MVKKEGGFLNLLYKKFPDPYTTIIFSLIIIFIINSGLNYNAVIAFSIATLTAFIVETSVLYFKFKKYIFPKTAIISSLIVVSIVDSGSWLIIFLAVLLALVLKHIIRYNDAPIFNPATSGLFVALMLNPNAGTWWANSNTLAILILGTIVSWRTGKLAISYSYLLSYIIISVLMNLFLYSNTFNQSFGLAVSFFPFFSGFMMLTEPRTSPNSVKAQLIFGVFAAIMMQLFQYLQFVSPFLIGIMLSNLLRYWLE